MARYHVVVRQVREIVVAVEMPETSLAKRWEKAAELLRAGKGTEVSDVTGDMHIHEVEGPVPEGFNPRFGYDSIYERDPLDYDDPDIAPYGASFDLIYWCRPVFDKCVHPGTTMMNHNVVKKILEKEGVIRPEDGCDSESGAVYFSWRTKQAGKDFIDRLNAWTEKKLAELTEPAA